MPPRSTRRRNRFAQLHRTSRRAKPALTLLHRDLLGDPGRVFGIGAGDRALVDHLVAQRADVLAQVENVRRGGGFGAVFGRDPIDHVLPGRVGRSLGRVGYRAAIPRDVLGLAGNLGRAGGGRLPG